MRTETRVPFIRPVLSVAIPVVLSLLVLTAGRPDPDRGKEVFETWCADCHTLLPPPDLAPPMVMVAGHYMQELETEEAVREAMVKWIPNPEEERSLLPEHAIEDFGLMARLPLPEDDLNAVVDYILQEWRKADSPEPHGPQCQCEGHEEGECECEGCDGGMQHRHGQEGEGMQHHPGQNGEGMQCRHGEEGEGCSCGVCRMKHGEQGEQMGEAEEGAGMERDMMRRHGQHGGDAMPTGHQCRHMSRQKN